MKTSQNGIELIKKFEGFSATPYFCPAHKLTVGYGHVIIAGEKFPAQGISQQEAEILLKQDVIVPEQIISRLVTYELQQNQFDALVSFIYNIGIKAFEKSTLLRLLQENKQTKAAVEFSKWIYAGGAVQNGLVRRRWAEREMFIVSHPADCHWQ